MLMKDWARAPGIAKSATATMAAAIDLEIISNILPVQFWRRNWTGEPARSTHPNGAGEEKAA
jgi:hypothetical protein